MSVLGRVFSERRSVVLPVVAFLILNVLALGAVFYLQGEMESVKSQADEAILSLGKAQLDERSAKGDLASKDLAEKELRKFYEEILPRDYASAVKITNFWLGKTARAAQVNYRAGQYDMEPVRDSRLSRVTGEITLLGDYADIRRFLYEVETAQEFVIIEKVALSQSSAIQANTQLEVQLSIVTYFLSEPQAGVVAK